MALVLLVDDEPAIVGMLCRHLRLAGHSCLSVQNGAEARALLAAHSVDLALLDVMLPGEDGFSLAPAFLEKNIPVLFLTARTSVSDRVYGLRLGADDYILKPFEPAELLARIEVILRRSRRDVYHDALLTLDFGACTACWNGELLSLTPLEFDLLSLLVQNAGAAMSREKLLLNVWGWNYVGETRTVDVHVQRLRAKLCPECIETVYKYGYRYIRRTQE